MTDVSVVFCLFEGPKSGPKDDSGDAPEMEKDPETKEVTQCQKRWTCKTDLLNKQEQNSHGVTAL